MRERGREKGKEEVCNKVCMCKYSLSHTHSVPGRGGRNQEEELHYNQSGDIMTMIHK